MAMDQKELDRILTVNLHVAIQQAEAKEELAASMEASAQKIRNSVKADRQIAEILRGELEKLKAISPNAPAQTGNSEGAIDQRKRGGFFGRGKR
jgi:hypothetical protein